MTQGPAVIEWTENRLCISAGLDQLPFPRGRLQVAEDESVRGKLVWNGPGDFIGLRQQPAQAPRPPDFEQAAQINVRRLGRVKTVEQPFERRWQE
jgi:hypothetical protein